MGLRLHDKVINRKTSITAEFYFCLSAKGARNFQTAVSSNSGVTANGYMSCHCGVAINMAAVFKDSITLYTGIASGNGITLYPTGSFLRKVCLALDKTAKVASLDGLLRDVAQSANPANFCSPFLHGLVNQDFKFFFHIFSFSLLAEAGRWTL